MQTRRDQLHAYRFQNKRALAALVTGEPNVLEPPMRRLTAMTISGIMIAVLVAVGAIVVGLIKPSSGDEWRAAGVIIDERSTGARFIRSSDGVLHPVLNYASAVLALAASAKGDSTGGRPRVVFVDANDIASAERGALIGVKGLPDDLPGASGLVSTPLTVCSQQKAGSPEQLTAAVTLTVGSRAGSTAIDPARSVYVQTVDASRRAQYLLHGGRRFLIGSSSVATALQLGGPAVTVATGLLSSLPAGPALAAPTGLSNEGNPSHAVRINGAAVAVGRLLQVEENRAYYVVLDDGIAPLNAVQEAIFRTLRFGAGTGQPATPLPVGENSVLDLPNSAQWTQVSSDLAGWPTALPTIDAAPARHSGVCAVFGSGATATLAAPAGALPTGYLPTKIVESSTSLSGMADEVDVASGHAALVRSASGGGTTTTAFIVASPGLKYAVPSAAVLTAFGYGSATATKLPPELLRLIPNGSPLDPSAALKPVGP